MCGSQRDDGCNPTYTNQVCGLLGALLLAGDPAMNAEEIFSIKGENETEN